LRPSGAPSPLCPRAILRPRRPARQTRRSFGWKRGSSQAVGPSLTKPGAEREDVRTDQRLLRGSFANCDVCELSRLGRLSGWRRCSLFVTRFANDSARGCLSSDLSGFVKVPVVTSVVSLELVRG